MCVCERDRERKREKEREIKEKRKRERKREKKRKERKKGERGFSSRPHRQDDEGRKREKGDLYIFEQQYKQRRTTKQSTNREEK